MNPPEEEWVKSIASSEERSRVTGTNKCLAKSASGQALHKISIDRCVAEAFISNV
jgi:hypothetical protein